MLAKCTQELEMEKNVGKLRKDCDCTKPCQETNLQLSVSSGQTGIKGSMTNLMFYSDYYKYSVYNRTGFLCFRFKWI